MTEVLKLDPTRDYGEVHGGHEEFPTARWEQFGVLFDAGLNAIEGSITPAKRAEIEKIQRVAKIKAEAERQMREALGESAPDGELLKVQTAAAAEASGTIDLKAWAMMKRQGKNSKIRPDQVTREVTKRYGISPKNLDQALRIIESDGSVDLTELA